MIKKVLILLFVTVKSNMLLYYYKRFKTFIFCFTMVAKAPKLVNNSEIKFEL